MTNEQILFEANRIINQEISDCEFLEDIKDQATLSEERVEYDNNHIREQLAHPDYDKEQLKFKEAIAALNSEIDDNELAISVLLKLIERFKKDSLIRCSRLRITDCKFDFVKDKDEEKMNLVISWSNHI